MKSYAIYFLIIICSFCTTVFAQQVDWSPPIQITFGEGEDIHCSSSNPDGFGGNAAWIAFTRSDSAGKNICLKKLFSGFVTWEDSVYYLTNDSITDDYPALTNYGDSLSMVVWQRDVGNYELFYRVKNGNEWLPPTQMTNDSADDILPQVYGEGNRCGLVWQRNGRILYSEFINNVWTTPEYVSPDSCINNNAPQLYFIEPYMQMNRPIVIWEKTSFPFHIEFAMKENNIWTTGTIPFSASECRNPKFVNKFFFTDEIGISCEGLQSNQWDVYTISCSYDVTFSWNTESNFSADSSSDDISASFYLCAIITKEQKWFPYIASTWLKKNYFSDSIAVQSILEFTPKIINTTMGSTDRAPIIFGIYGRVWSIWENNSAGQWKLYGTTADIPLSVEENISSSSFYLSQNYPNPFNPKTVISFSIPLAPFSKGNGEVVSLKIYDILGKEAATLINNETMQAGKHEIQFDGSTLTSGVYFYRLNAGTFSETKKFIIAK